MAGTLPHMSRLTMLSCYHAHLPRAPQNLRMRRLGGQRLSVRLERRCLSDRTHTRSGPMFVLTARLLGHRSAASQCVSTRAVDEEQLGYVPLGSLSAKVSRATRYSHRRAGQRSNLKRERTFGTASPLAIPFWAGGATAKGTYRGGMPAPGCAWPCARVEDDTEHRGNESGPVPFETGGAVQAIVQVEAHLHCERCMSGAPLAHSASSRCAAAPSAGLDTPLEQPISAGRCRCPAHEGGGGGVHTAVLAMRRRDAQPQSRPIRIQESQRAPNARRMYSAQDAAGRFARLNCVGRRWRSAIASSRRRSHNLNALYFHASIFYLLIAPAASMRPC